jgi:hypothetical protein
VYSRNQRVARPLGEEAQHGSNQETTAHAGCLEDVGPGLLGRFKLDADGGLHLGHLGGNKLLAAVSLSVVFGKDIVSLLGTVLGDKPAGTLGEEAFW